MTRDLLKVRAREPLSLCCALNAHFVRTLKIISLSNAQRSNYLSKTESISQNHTYRSYVYNRRRDAFPLPSFYMKIVWGKHHSAKTKANGSSPLSDLVAREIKIYCWWTKCTCGDIFPGWSLSAISREPWMRFFYKNERDLFGSMPLWRRPTTINGVALISNAIAYLRRYNSFARFFLFFFSIIHRNYDDAM